MTTSTISFNANTQGGPLELAVFLDSVQVYQAEINDLKQKIEIVVNEEDQEQKHVLELHMRGKLPSHTILDTFGQIKEDRLLEITDITLDEIDINQVFVKNARYKHDFNGTNDETEEIFYGTMGCNGTVTLEFSTPAYLWLLQNM